MLSSKEMNVGMEIPATDAAASVPSEAETPMAEDSSTAAKPVSKWAVHRRLYDWVLSLAHRKHASTALFALAFAESSVFPIPPDVLQITLTLERRDRAWFYAFISLVGSVLGAMLGFLIGWAFWQATQGFFYQYLFTPEQFGRVSRLYADYNFWVVFVAAFTPIPFKVITIAAGVCHISFPMFVIAAIIGRGARFFLVAGLLYFFGPSVRRFIDKYFNLVCIVFTVGLIGGFVLIKYLLN